LLPHGIFTSWFMTNYLCCTTRMMINMKANNYGKV